MQSYVLGFCFSRHLTEVVLVAKTRPAWQAGRLNGIGGKVEVGERPTRAMAREFHEETLCGDDLDWEPFGRLRGGEWEVWLFHSHFQTVPSNESSEGRVSVHSVSSVLTRPTSQGYAPLPNLRYLIPMALNHLGSDYRTEFLEVRETTCPLKCEDATADPPCTGFFAAWCPTHGECKCDRENDDLSNPACPLHSENSTHAERHTTCPLATDAP